MTLRKLLDFTAAFFRRMFTSQKSYKMKERYNKSYSRRKKKSKFSVLKGRLKSYLRLFLETSSIHGLNHIIASRRHPCEILLWLAMVGVSVYGILSLSRATWVRYQSSPTVVSMERDMYAWNTSFPCVTLCPDKKLDTLKLIDYIKNSDEPDKVKLEEFITALANATFETFESVPDYNGIPASKYMELILSLAPDFNPSVVIGATGLTFEIVPTITEMGLCYAMNSMIAVYNSPSYRARNKWDFVKPQNETFSVHPLDGQVFAQLIDISTAYNAYVHGSLEVPDISTKHERSQENFYMKIYMTALTVYTSSAAAKLSVNQRRCRFTHENILKHNAVYSYTLCRMECRIKLCLEYCGCIPHFYRKIGYERVCDVKGLHCLAKYKDVLYKLRDESGKKMDCACYPNCDDINYVILTSTNQEWYLGTNLQWGIATYPRMRYRRDIIFGFTDVLVAVGGMAGLFLGCSVLSFMEIAYFCTLRFYWYLRGR